MEYAFRPNLIQRHRGVRLADGRLELIGPDGQVHRSHYVTDIRSVQIVHAGRSDDATGGKRPMEHCIVRVRGGRSVVLKSASYCGPNQWADQTLDYNRFVRALVQQLAQTSPETPVCKGSRGLVVTWMVIGTASTALLVLGLGVLLSPLFSNKAFGDVVVPGVGLMLFSSVCGLISVAMAQTYRPSCVTAREAVE